MIRRIGSAAREVWHAMWRGATTFWHGIVQLQTLAAALLTLLGLMWGWPTIHKQNLERDRAAKATDVQVEYLIQAYRRLESAAGRTPVNETDEEHLGHAQDVEGAIGDIQLFGDPGEVELARKAAEEIAGPGPHTVDLSPLLMLLRQHLRRELQLDPLETTRPLQLRLRREPAAEERAPAH